MSSSWRWVVIIGVLAVFAVLVAGRPSEPSEDERFAPDSTSGSGAKAMVLLLEGLGAEVEVDEGVPDDSSTAAILLEDRLDQDRADELLDWVHRGGTLVVADPESPLTPLVTGPVTSLDGFEDDDVPAQHCDIEDLAEVERVAPAGGAIFEAPDSATTCFGDSRRAFVVEEVRGEGRLLSVGGQGPFVNDHLGEADNAVLVAQLLAADPEGTTVSFLVPDPDVAAEDGRGGDRPGEGDDSLLDLVPDRVGLALLQLALAFAAYVWFRARRIGKPVSEPRPTPLAGSELVGAVGHLRREEKDAERSASILREDLRRTLCRRLGVPQDTPVEHLVAIAEQSGADPDRLRAALEGRAGDDDALVTLARSIDQTRQEVLHEQH